MVNKVRQRKVYRGEYTHIYVNKKKYDRHSVWDTKPQADRKADELRNGFGGIKFYAVVRKFSSGGYAVFIRQRK